MGYQPHQRPCCNYIWMRSCKNNFDWVILFLELITLWPLAFCLFMIMGTGLFIFAVLAAEIFKLGFFPLMINGITHEHMRYVSFYRYLFNFLQSAESTKDQKLRLALANKNLLESHFERVPIQDVSGTENLERRVREKRFTDQDPMSVHFSQMYGFNSGDDGMSCRQCLSMCWTSCTEDQCARIRQGCDCFEDLVECYAFTIFGPYDVLSALFTVFFPIIAFCLTDYNDVTDLQAALTYIYSGTLFIVLCFGVYVYKFFRLSSSIFAPTPHRNAPVVDGIISYWKDFISTRIRNDIIKGFLPDIAPVILEFAGPTHRVHDIEWVPGKNWLRTGREDIGMYTDWKYATSPRKMANEQFDFNEDNINGKKCAPFECAIELIVDEKRLSKNIYGDPVPIFIKTEFELESDKDEEKSEEIESTSEEDLKMEEAQPMKEHFTSLRFVDEYREPRVHIVTIDEDEEEISI